MSGPLEVRQFLLRYEGGEPAAAGVPTQRGGAADSPRISDTQIWRARRAVATGAQDTEDCHQLLEMLGLMPEADGLSAVQR
jgi:hypothetical protein